MVGLPLMLVTRWRKRRAILAYARRLPHLLRRDYGACGSYTARQIRQTIRRDGLSLDYSCYALSMFADRGDFNDFHAALGETCDYDAMRAEAAELAGPALVSPDGSPAPPPGFADEIAHIPIGHGGGPGLWSQ
jgi:hypothetical protein